MRKFLFVSATLLATLVMMQSCTKEVPSELIREITIDTTIAAGASYSLNLAPMGTEDNIASILDPGTQFTTSTFENVTDMFTTVYQYTSSPEAKGTDHVVLAISQNPAGKTQVSKDSTIIYINLSFK